MLYAQFRHRKRFIQKMNPCHFETSTVNAKCRHEHTTYNEEGGDKNMNTQHTTKKAEHTTCNEEGRTHNIQ